MAYCHPGENGLSVSSSVAGTLVMLLVLHHFGNLPLSRGFFCCFCHLLTNFSECLEFGFPRKDLIPLASLYRVSLGHTCESTWHQMTHSSPVYPKWDWSGGVTWYDTKSLLCKELPALRAGFPQKGVGISLGCKGLWLFAVRTLPPRVAVRMEGEC